MVAFWSAHRGFLTEGEWDHPPLRGRPRRPTPPQAQQQKRNLPTPRQLRYHTLSYRIWKQFGALEQTLVIKQGGRPQTTSLSNTPRQLRYHTLSSRIWKQFGALVIKQGGRPPISLSYAVLPDLETGWSFGFPTPAAAAHRCRRPPLPLPATTTPAEHPPLTCPVARHCHASHTLATLPPLPRLPLPRPQG